ncbi:MAG: hypothetical protein V5A48_11480 [Salinivenus sp.]
MALPELRTSDSAARNPDDPDLEVVREPIDEVDGVENVNGVVQSTAEKAVLHYDHTGAFRVEDGRRIVVDVAVDTSERLARHLILGVCTGLALHQKGHLTLHASAVGLEDGVAAFIGWKRRGKSTTASALHASGSRLVTDDIVAIPPGNDAMVPPGFPQMRLDPEAVAATRSATPEALPRLHADHRKRIGRADRRFQREPRPLRCIYLLEWGNDFEVEPLSPRDAFVRLLQHSYAQRFLGNTAATPSHFEKVNKLVEAVPGVKLERPRDLDRLPDMVRFVRSHFRSL